ncbi:MAG: transglycosylase domain-containing protein [Ruminococcus sp.]|nr:transglycosylase domain-containing protein [Ruminococcus sp.]
MDDVKSTRGADKTPERPLRASGKKKKKKKPTSLPVKIIKGFGIFMLSLFLIIVITGSIFATVMTIYVLNFADTTTTVSLDKTETSNISRFLYENPNYDEEDPDSNEYELYYAIRNTNRHVAWVDIENIPQTVQDAFVYTEDERFYSHDGVDFKRTFAAFVNVFIPIYGGRQIGGSTITQQTIKLITGDDSRDSIKGMERKIREIFRSINVEKTYTKEDILQSYLNIVPMNTQKYDIVGVQAAANFYFGKDVSELDLAEAASLAGMTNMPGLNNPYDNPKGNKERRIYCLDHMLSNGAISEDEYKQAVNEEIVVTGDISFSSAAVYDDEDRDFGPTSWFMDAALNETEQRIAEAVGITTEEASERLRDGGFTVYTTVDINMQEKVQDKMLDASNFTTYYMDPEDDTLWSGFIAMDYYGNVKAVVGSRNEKTESRIYSTVTDATRSPGSCIKPIASYAPALDQDLMTCSTLFNDRPIEIEIDGSKQQWPVNYSEYGDDGNWSYKDITTTEMLQRSLNTLPAQLIDKMTPAYSYSFLKDKLDISTLEESDATYAPVTVGGLTNGTKLEELVGAYMIFGNGGKKYDVSYVSKIEDIDGNVIYEKTDGYKQAISESTSYVMNRMMQHVITEQDGTGRYAKLSNTDLIGKTGTSSDWNDLTFVGCTPDYVSGVWIGYENPERIPTNDYQNIGAIWKNIFGDIADSEPHKSFDQTFEMPESVEKLRYCKSTGLLAGAGCSNTAEGYYKKSNEPEFCSGYH